MTDYSTIKIVPPNWPQLYQLDDERWQRVWNIELADNQTDEVDLNKIQEILSTDEITVIIKKEAKFIQIEVTTTRWGWEDDLIWYSYTILRVISEHIREIQTIQGQELKIWLRHLR